MEGAINKSVPYFIKFLCAAVWCLCAHWRCRTSDVTIQSNLTRWVKGRAGFGQNPKTSYWISHNEDIGRSPRKTYGKCVPESVPAFVTGQTKVNAISRNYRARLEMKSNVVCALTGLSVVGWCCRTVDDCSTVWRARYGAITHRVLSSKPAATSTYTYVRHDNAPPKRMAFAAFTFHQERGSEVETRDLLPRLADVEVEVIF